mgnify:CR=1 FL=1
MNRDSRFAVAGGILAALVTTGVQGQNSGQLAGGDLTHGGASPYERSVGLGTNPANPSLGERWLRFGVLSNVGIGLEIGEAEDFDSKIEDISDEFDQLENSLQSLEDISVGTPSQSEINRLSQLLQDIDTFEDSANQTVSDLSDNAYAKLSVDATGPGAPLSLRFERLSGVVTLDYGVSLEARAGLESSGKTFDTGIGQLVDANGNLNVQITPSSNVDVSQNANGFSQITIDNDTFTLEPESDSGLAVQGGVVQNVGLGYARKLFENDFGTLHGGATASFYRVTLARSGILLNDTDNVGNQSEDEFDDNQATNTGFGIDAGLTWVTDHYSAGGTLRNLNAPSFDYPDTCDNPNSESCAFFTANPEAKRNGDSFTMERQLTLDGSLHTADRRWLLAGRLDANSIVDATGDDYQWAAISAAYRNHRFWVPSPRLGARTNLTGSELTYVSAGATLFRALHFDVSRSLGSTSIDDTSIPRAVQISVGLDLQF